MFALRWKFIGEPGTESFAKGRIFRVVDAHARDIVAFTEIGSGLGNGYTWRGTATEFKKQFAPMKAEPTKG